MRLYREVPYRLPVRAATIAWLIVLTLGVECAALRVAMALIGWGS